MELFVQIGYLQAVKERKDGVLLMEIVMNCLLALAIEGQ
jgi:hypothetical protein